VNLEKKNIAERNARARRQSRCDVVSIPVRLPLEGCMGQRRIGTNNVHADDLSIGLLDLLQFSATSVSAAIPPGHATLPDVPQEIPES
jgi:hypothetical protein